MLTQYTRRPRDEERILTEGAGYAFTNINTRWILACLTLAFLMSGTSLAQAAEEPAHVSPPDQSAPASGDVQERAIRRAPMGIPQLSPLPRGPVRASTDVSCSNGKKFSIGTGTNLGKCDVHINDERVTGGHCTDSKGNDSFVGCDVGCKGTSGAGNCKDTTPPK